MINEMKSTKPRLNVIFSQVPERFHPSKSFRLGISFTVINIKGFCCFYLNIIIWKYKICMGRFYD